MDENTIKNDLNKCINNIKEADIPKDLQDLIKFMIESKIKPEDVIKRLNKKDAENLCILIDQPNKSEDDINKISELISNIVDTILYDRYGDKFKSYENVRLSGLYNMFDKKALKMSGLDKQDYLYIISNYARLRNIIEDKETNK